MDETYELSSIYDVLKVPIDRREACMRDLLYAFALHDLAFGDSGDGTPIGPMVWTDDGRHDVDLSVNGEPLLALRVESKTTSA